MMMAHFVPNFPPPVTLCGFLCTVFRVQQLLVYRLTRSKSRTWAVPSVESRWIKNVVRWHPLTCFTLIVAHQGHHFPSWHMDHPIPRQWLRCPSALSEVKEDHVFVVLTCEFSPFLSVSLSLSLLSSLSVSVYLLRLVLWSWVLKGKRTVLHSNLPTTGRLTFGETGRHGV